MAHRRNLPNKNALEWTVFALSLLLVLSALGFLAHAALTLEDRPADLLVELGQPEQRGAHFSVPVTVHNRGGRTAEDVRVEVSLEVGEDVVETTELELPLISYQSSGEGMAAFTQDPRGGKLAARVLGYLTP